MQLAPQHRDANDELQHMIRSLVTCLAISMASSLLLVGTSAGSIRIFDIASHQLLRSILVHKDKGLRISTLATILKPLDLVGHINLNLSADAKDGPPIHPKPVVPFMKMRDAKAREKREVWMMEGDGDDADTASLSHSSASLAESILREQAAFLQPNRGASTAPSDAALAPSVESLQSEIASLRTQLGKAKVLNDAMWERVVHKVVLMDRPDEE
jgi:pre-rRNA-processing protein IPI3